MKYSNHRLVVFSALNNAPLRYYRGLPERVLQEETYRWWSEFGIRFLF